MIRKRCILRKLGLGNLALQSVVRVRSGGGRGGRDPLVGIIVCRAVAVGVCIRWVPTGANRSGASRSGLRRERGWKPPTDGEIELDAC